MTVERQHLVAERATRRRWLGFGVAALAVAVCASVAGTSVLEGVQAADGTLVTGVRTGGYLTGPNATPMSTYVIVGPNGILLAPDGTPLPNVTPVTYTDGTQSAPMGALPASTIFTPTPVLPGAVLPASAIAGGARGQFIVGGVDSGNSAAVQLPPPVTSGQFPTAVGSLPVQTISTPTAVVAPVAGTGQSPVTASGLPIQTISTPTAVAFPATGDAATTATVAATGNLVGAVPTQAVGPDNPYVLSGTPSGGTNGMGVVANPGRGVP